MNQVVDDQLLWPEVLDHLPLGRGVTPVVLQADRDAEAEVVETVDGVALERDGHRCVVDGGRRERLHESQLVEGAPLGDGDFGRYEVPLVVQDLPDDPP